MKDKKYTWAVALQNKQTDWPERTVKTQISMDIRQVWSESLRRALASLGHNATSCGQRRPRPDWANA